MKTNINYLQMPDVNISKDLEEFYIQKDIYQALFFCNICVVFRPVLAFRDLLFIHALTNATDDHKYSPLPSADFDSSAVLVSFLELHFYEKTKLKK